MVGRLWEIVARAISVSGREIVGDCGRLWEIVGDCGILWETVEGCGRLWHAPCPWRSVIGGEIVGDCGTRYVCE